MKIILSDKLIISYCIPHRLQGIVGNSSSCFGEEMSKWIHFHAAVNICKQTIQFSQRRSYCHHKDNISMCLQTQSPTSITALTLQFLSFDIWALVKQVLTRILQIFQIQLEPEFEVPIWFNSKATVQFKKFQISQSISYIQLTYSNFCSRTHRLATIHSVQTTTTTDGRNTVPIAWPLVQSVKNLWNS